MAIKFDRTAMIIPPSVGAQSFNGSITFPAGVVIQDAAVALEGFSLTLRDAAGNIAARRIATTRVDVQVIPPVGNNIVSFIVSLELGDAGGGGTEEYSGDVSVFAIIQH